jgi:eukaryotic-like serine/threonine-protein kinase
MKKIFPVFVVLIFVISACQLGGGNAQPTPLAFPTAFPSPTVAAIGTQAASNQKPAPGTARSSPGDGMIQVYIPEGTFQMGAADAKGSLDEQPVHAVTMHGFWMDKVEVTNAMFTICLKAGGCIAPAQIKSQTRASYFSNPDFANYPVVYVSWSAADSYCKWAGRRLPTEAEWERAARGDDLRTYPWGDQRPQGSQANFGFLVGDTTAVGSYPAGASPYGILDMAGNVAEWVHDFYSGDYYKNPINMNPPGPINRSNIFNRVVRGGSFQDAESDIRVAKRSSVLGPNPDAPLGSAEYIGDVSPKIGFRCAADN